MSQFRWLRCGPSRTVELHEIQVVFDLISVLPFGDRPDDFRSRSIPRKRLSEMVFLPGIESYTAPRGTLAEWSSLSSRFLSKQ